MRLSLYVDSDGGQNFGVIHSVIGGCPLAKQYSFKVRPVHFLLAHGYVDAESSFDLVHFDRFPITYLQERTFY